MQAEAYSKGLSPDRNQKVCRLGVRSWSPLTSYKQNSPAPKENTP